jgi:E3 ubiquitin-protein ligase XIAP/baculoviral IAP repeat-containing protein 2/3
LTEDLPTVSLGGALCCPCHRAGHDEVDHPDVVRHRIQGQRFFREEGGGGTILEKEHKCKVCMERMIDCVFLGCGHLMACTCCGQKLVSCPICQKRIVRVAKIYRTRPGCKVDKCGKYKLKDGKSLVNHSLSSN